MNEKTENQLRGGTNGYVIYVPLPLLQRGGGGGGVTVNSFSCHKNWSHHTENFTNEFQRRHSRINEGEIGGWGGV